MTTVRSFNNLQLHGKVFTFYEVKLSLRFTESCLRTGWKLGVSFNPWSLCSRREALWYLLVVPRTGLNAVANRKVAEVYMQ